MPNLSYLRARVEGASTAAAVATQESSSSLSLGAIIGIAVGGSVVLFAALTPVLILLARWQDRRRTDAAAIVAACCPLSSSTFAAVGGDGERGTSRRLRKKSVTSEHVVLFGGANGTAAMSQVSMAGARRESLPVLPPVVSRPGSFNMVDYFITAAGGARSDSSGDGTSPMVKKQRSPDKERGYMIYQNRRKTSWIDEDALHGPSISPKKNGGVAKRNPSWVANFGRGLSRSLSRRFSVRRGVAGASQLVGRSPTLPYTETARGSRSGSPERSPGVDEKAAPVRQDVGEAHDIEAGISPVATTQHQNSHYQNQSPEKRNAPSKAYTWREDQTSRPRGPPKNAAMLHNSSDNKPINNNHNNIPDQRNTAAFTAAQQLAGSARLPTSMTVPAAPMGPRPRPGPGHRRTTQSNTDAELQAILRRTAERLQDGKQSARRQTMMTPANTSSLPTSPMKTPNSRNQASVPSTPSRSTNGRYDPAVYDSMTKSPAKSQKSAPAVMAICNELPAELDGKSLQIPAPAATSAHGLQPQGQGQTPRRHTRQTSQISQISMGSEADSLVPSRRGSQQNMIQTPLSSPSRGGPVKAPAADPSKQHAQVRPLSAVAALQRPFSMASTESSALSTVYSEEETSIMHKSPPISNARANEAANQHANPTTHMERQAMQHALSVCDAFVKRSSQMSLDGVGGRKFTPSHDASPRPLRVRRGTMRQETVNDTKANNTTATTATTSQQQQQTPKPGPPSFTIHAMDEVANDPFTVATPSPPQSIPTRLSKLFSPIPAKGSSAPNSPSSQKSSRAAAREPKKDETPTRSHSSRRRVVPPPHVLHSRAGEPRSTGAAQSSYSINDYQFPEPPSPAQSEGGLSSVYESYAYRDSSYGSYELGGGASLVNEEYEDQQTEPATTARNSIVTIVTAPTTAATSPTRGNSNSSSESPSSRTSRSRYRSRDALAASARQQQQQQSGIPPGPAVIAEEPKPHPPSTISITVKSPSPTAPAPRPRRHTRTSSSSSRRSGASDESSRYSQDDEGEAANAVPPLHLSRGFSSSRLHHKQRGAPAAAATTNTSTAQRSVHINANTRYARVASTVAELRRMNSQVSCVSTTSSSAAAAATTTTTTGDFKKTAASGGAGSGKEGDGEKKKPEASPTLPDLRGGGFSPGRSGTRAGGRNYLALGSVAAPATTATTSGATAQQEERSAVAASPGRGAAVGDRETKPRADRSSLRTHATKLAPRQQLLQQGTAGNRASIQSIESLGLYDEDGFLKNSPERQGFLSAVARQAQ